MAVFFEYLVAVAAAGGCAPGCLTGLAATFTGPASASFGTGCMTTVEAAGGGGGSDGLIFIGPDGSACGGLLASFVVAAGVSFGTGCITVEWTCGCTAGFAGDVAVASVCAGFLATPSGFVFAGADASVCVGVLATSFDAADESFGTGCITTVARTGGFAALVFVGADTTVCGFTGTPAGAIFAGAAASACGALVAALAIWLGDVDLAALSCARSARLLVSLGLVPPDACACLNNFSAPFRSCASMRETA